MDCCCCHQKTKHRSPEEQKSLVNRLSRIEGQVRGLRDMLQKDAYCTDILIQVSAVNAALNSFSKELLATHIRTCVADGIRRPPFPLPLRSSSSGCRHFRQNYSSRWPRYVSRYKNKDPRAKSRHGR